MIKEGFFKVNESGFSLTIATFFNPTTKEYYTQMIWDNDDFRTGNEHEEERYTPIDEEARKAWLRFNGIISEGDTVEVSKGEKCLSERLQPLPVFMIGNTHGEGYKQPM